VPPETCPNCGADVPPRAKACPECGACDETGWSEAAQASGLGLPDDSFDYEAYVAQEFGPRRSLPRGLSWFWWVVAIAVVAALFFLVIR
jgi:hypothetical protein